MSHNHRRNGLAGDLSLRCPQCRSDFIARYTDTDPDLAAAVWDSFASSK